MLLCIQFPSERLIFALGELVFLTYSLILIDCLLFLDTLFFSFSLVNLFITCFVFSVSICSSKTHNKFHRIKIVFQKSFHADLLPYPTNTVVPDLSLSLSPTAFQEMAFCFFSEKFLKQISHFSSFECQIRFLLVGSYKFVSANKHETWLCGAAIF